MIIHDKVRQPLILAGMFAAFAVIFYVLPAAVITPLYATASFATFVFLICMLQSHMTDSTVWFRLAIAGLAAGCLATAITPFTNSYSVGPWALIKALALLAVIFLIRLRQVRSRSARYMGSAFPG